jgi:hypothetical protein
MRISTGLVWTNGHQSTYAKQIRKQNQIAPNFRIRRLCTIDGTEEKVPFGGNQEFWQSEAERPVSSVLRR